ncbi:helix-turn-helix transcriptional regulator [Tsukamurella sp. 8F]|uniref:helix-turn-helix domain-containing protein n=1 Tax=unclassified Tsukamurella TaxID=2633480 RepID=UPI0023B91003|nr:MULTISPECIES: helix-turn-helix transcriptional regulator [unclassified Tsukamurella]MDF0528678.1 helix-turn-helix transcriptional regulator [Tsukamurella sp. 8J]MDF0585640.1 helix-turn-helix transcriptional regulator [Tsukamurella sp. 8F]
MPREESSIEWVTYGDSLAHRLVAIRKERGLSQEALAQLAGVHRNQVSNIERNVSSGDRSADPHLSTIYALASALGVAPKLLLPDVDTLVARRSAEQESAEAMSRVEDDLRELLQRTYFRSTEE